MFYKKRVRRNFAKFTGKYLCQSLFLNKVTCLSPATFLKKRLWCRCFPVNFVKFLRAPFFIEHLWWLLRNNYYFLCQVFYLCFSKALTLTVLVRPITVGKVYFYRNVLKDREDEYCEIFKSTYFEEHLQTAASENVFMKLRKNKNCS